MHRVGTSWHAAAAAALVLAACGESRVLEAPSAGTSGCASCHAAPGEAPPFRDQTGSVDSGRLSVGAHDAHLHGDLVQSISCAECHTVPRTVTAPGHLEDSPGDVRFGPLARTGGVDPRYEAPGCAATYCHGNFPGGNRSNAPTWLAGAGAAKCGSCHVVPSGSGRHPEHATAGVSCVECHGPFVAATHVNGVKDVPLPAWRPTSATCAQACHLPRSWRAPGDASL